MGFNSGFKVLTLVAWRSRSPHCREAADPTYWFTRPLSLSAPTACFVSLVCLSASCGRSLCQKQR